MYNCSINELRQAKNEKELERFRMKILCVLLPHFALRCESLRRAEYDNRKIILTYNDPAAEGSKLVLDYSPELEKLQRDLPLQQALSRYGEAEILQADVPYYWSEFNHFLDESGGCQPAGGRD